MEQTKYLIDTNTVIDFLGQKIPEAGMFFVGEIVDQTPQVSIITKIEVLGFVTEDKHYTVLTDFMKDANILALSNEIVEATISIRKKHKIKLPDAIIAATALVNGLCIVSRNSKDFQNIENLVCYDPYLI